MVLISPAEHLKERFGLDFAYANKLEVTNGVFSGRVHEPILDAHMKAQLLIEVAARENIPLEQTIAIGDGAKMTPSCSLKQVLALHFIPNPSSKSSFASVSSGGLERILYLLGMSGKDVEEFLRDN